jgi:hypothetical protein
VRSRARSPQRGETCGIFGGQQLDFIRHYAAQALALLERPENRVALRKLDRKANHTVLVEQYLLAACIDYHQSFGSSAYAKVQLEYLFSSMDEAFLSDRPQKLGYTHLIANAKQNAQALSLLETRVAHDWPAQYERCRAWEEKLR